MEAEKTDWCKSMDQYAASKGLKGIECYVVQNKDTGGKDYAICNKDGWIYGSPRFEDVAVRIDMIALTQTQKPPEATP